MIELRRIVLVNWHMMQCADLDLVGDAAILGQNRSGKSTLIDLIQAVIAGGSSNFYRFNRSAGEGAGRSDRTLASYCLGQLNEQTFLRPEARTHIALVFEDSDGKRPPVSLGLSIEAFRGQPADILGRFICEGVRIDSAMLLDEIGGASRPTPWPALRRRLDEASTARGGQLHTPGDAKTFIREYMRLLFTGRRTADPERFVRTFIAALSFTDMASVEEFVRRYLLDPKPINIAELRESIQRYREIQRTIRELEQRLEALRAIAGNVETFAKLLEEEEDCRALAAIAELLETAGALFANIAELKQKSHDFADTGREIDALGEEIKRETEALEAIQLQLAASGAASERAVAQSRIREIEREHGGVMDRLQARYRAAARTSELFELGDRLASINPGELMKALAPIRASSAGLAPPDWPKDPAAMDALLDTAARAAAARIPKATERRNEAIIWAQRLEDEMREDREQLAAAREGRISLSPPTMKLIEALRRENMNPRTLAEVADVVDETWRGALEALLGRDREAIIVDPEHAFRATTILRHGRDAYPRCRVANTLKLQYAATEPKAGMLASMIRSEDRLAMAFVVFRIGNVRLAHSQEELLADGRAVMTDGAYHDGLITEVRRADGAKIGQAAAPLREADLIRQIDQRHALLDNHRKNAGFFEDVIRRLEECAKPVEAADTLDAIALRLDEVAERRREAHGRLERISAQADPELVDAEARSKALLAGFRADLLELTRRHGSLKTGVEEVRRRLGGGDLLPGSYMSLAQRRRRFKAAVHSLPRWKRLRTLYDPLRPRPPARIAADMLRKAEDAKEEYRALDSAIRVALGRYALNFPDALENYAHAPIIGTVRPWVDEGIATLEGNELIRYGAQADEAADRVARLFRTTFIHELNNRFGELQAEMENFARALRSRPLHGETYRLEALVKPVYENLYHLARDSEHDETALDALFGRAAATNERHAKALQQVEQLLADDSFDFSVFEDYRSYFTYDLQSRDVKTGVVNSFDRRRGVASGAERQVPFYVVIGAALAGSYHGSRRVQDKGEFGMGLAVFDEAFSKMDGPNQRSLLDFYRAIGLQVVIAAPSEKRAVVLENLDTIIDVYRSGNVALAEASRIKERAREEMRAANPQHATDEELAAALGEPRAAE